MSAAPLPLCRWLWPKSLGGKTAAAFVYALLSLISLWLFAWSAAERRYAGAIGRCEQLGLSKSWDELLGPRIATERNAADSLNQAGEHSFKVWGETLRALRRANDAVTREEEFDVVAARLRDDPEFNRLLAEADARPEYRSILLLDAKRTVDMMEAHRQLHKLRDVARLESRIAEGLSPREGVERSLRTLRLLRKWGDGEPSLAAALLNTSVRITALDTLHRMIRAGLPAGSHSLIEDELQKQERVERLFVRCWDGERYIQAQIYHEIAWIHRVGVLTPISVLADVHTLESVAAFVGTVGRPFQEALPALARQHPLSGLPFLNIDRQDFNAYIDLQTAASRKSTDALKARVRCWRIVNAMAAKNDFLAPLDALGLPAECLLDPFGGGSLKLKRAGNGAIIYSVGCDLDDDDGTPQTNSIDGDIAYGPVESGGKAK